MDFLAGQHPGFPREADKSWVLGGAIFFSELVNKVGPEGQVVTNVALCNREALVSEQQTYSEELRL